MSSSMGFGWHPIYEMENKKCSNPPTSVGVSPAIFGGRVPISIHFCSLNPMIFHMEIHKEMLHWWDPRVYKLLPYVGKRYVLIKCL